MSIFQAYFDITDRAAKFPPRTNYRHRNRAQWKVSTVHKNQRELFNIINMKSSVLYDPKMSRATLAQKKKKGGLFYIISKIA